MKEIEIKRRKLIKPTMVSGSGDGDNDCDAEFLQIHGDGRFLSRLLSKEASKDEAREPSFRVLYYGGSAGSVPFTWESRPGTPKHPSSGTSMIPPLTPPPSYLFGNSRAKSRRPYLSKLGFLFAGVFSRINNVSGKGHVSAASFSSSSVSSSCSSSSFPSSQMNSSVRRRGACCYPCSRITAHSVGEDEDERRAAKSATSILCFGRS
ncbi:uncharacterized protein LOC127796483 [Diospyros lotus]|uniref:uncharacterized protein LOC127796483 n=1 Tax=Diospyros lotus TaxID=55363 RepID=UPI0022594FF0|nr:uncharacterized protein LOC127796483 [Diospyros lotus]